MYALTRRLYSSFKQRRMRSLKKLVDLFAEEVMKSSSKLAFRLSLLSYVLAKMITKTRFFEEEMKERVSKVESLLKKLTEKVDEATLDEIERTIIGMEREDARFVFDLFTKGRVKIAALLYAKGMSLGKVSKLSGIPKQEILAYAGKTMMFDRLKDEVPVKKRLRIARSLLGD